MPQKIHRHNERVQILADAISDSVSNSFMNTTRQYDIDVLYKTVFPKPNVLY